jgi:hypothetical protein
VVFIRGFYINWKFRWSMKIAYRRIFSYEGTYLIDHKPDGVAKNLIGEVIRRIEAKGLKVIAAR